MRDSKKVGQKERAKNSGNGCGPLNDKAVFCMVAAAVAPEVPGKQVGAEQWGTRLSPALGPAALGAFRLSLQARPLRTASLPAQSVRASPRMLGECSEKALQRCLATGSALTESSMKVVLGCAQNPTPPAAELPVVPRNEEASTQHNDSARLTAGLPGFE